MENITCNQILAILDVLPIDVYDRIPEDLIRKFNANKDENYKFVYDINKSINDQNVTDETKKLYAYLYENYLSSDDEIAKFKKKDEDYQKAYDSMRVSGENVFQNNIRMSEENSKANNEETHLVIRAVENDNSFLKKIFNGIKRLFGKY